MKTLLRACVLAGFVLLLCPISAAAQAVNGPIGMKENTTAQDRDNGVLALVKRCDSAASSASSDGKYAVLCSDSSGRLYVNCPSCSGGIQYLEDAAHSSGDTGTMPLGVRNALCGTPLSGANGDYNPLQLDASGNLCISIAGNTAGSTTVTAGATIAAGDASVAETASQLYIYNGSAPARLAFGQAVKASSLPVSRASDDPPVPGTLKSGFTAAMTATTSTAVIAAQASNYLYATSCSFSNTHASVTTMMSLQDGSGGTVLWTGIVPFGGGSNITFPAPLKVPTLGNALYVVNVTTGSNTFASCSGFYSTASY